MCSGCCFCFWQGLTYNPLPHCSLLCDGICVLRFWLLRIEFIEIHEISHKNLWDGLRTIWLWQVTSCTVYPPIKAVLQLSFTILWARTVVRQVQHPFPTHPVLTVHQRRSHPPIHGFLFLLLSEARCLCCIFETHTIDLRCGCKGIWQELSLTFPSLEQENPSKKRVMRGLARWLRS